MRRLGPFTATSDKEKKMKHIVITTLAMIVIAAAAPASAVEGAIVYPQTKRIDHVDTYHGTVVADPYRWLEDDVRESEGVADWVAAQNKVSFGYLETLPDREAIEERYHGCHTSLADYVQELTEETTTIPESLRYYIDWQAMARDAEMSGGFLTVETAWNEVHVFAGC